MKFAIHQSLESDSLPACGEIIRTIGDNYYINTADQFTLIGRRGMHLGSKLRLTGKLKVAPIAECLTFDTETEMVAAYFAAEMTPGEIPEGEVFTAPDHGYIEETPL